MPGRFDAAFLALVALLPFPAWGAVIDVPSAWLATPPAEAGGKVAWEGIVLPLGDSPLSAAVRNDRDSLYVRVRTSDPEAQRRIRMTGLTVWVDHAGKEKRGFGVRFPIGSGAGGGRRGGFPGAPGEGTSGSPDGGPRSDPAAAPSEMELIGPGENDRIVVPASGGGGAWARLDANGDILTVELRFPLHATDDHPLAVGSAPGGTISIGFEAEKPRRAGGGEGRPEGGAPGGMHGGGGMGGPGGGTGGHGGGMGGPGGGHRSGAMRGNEALLSTAIKVWTRVTLAQEPPPAPAPAP